MRTAMTAMTAKTAMTALTATAAAAALLLAAAGCGATPTSRAFASGGDDGAVSEVDPDAAPPSVDRVSVIGTVHDAVTTNTVAGATICVFEDPSRCTTSAADGTFTLDGVPSASSGVVVDASGYATGLWAMTASAPRVALAIRPADHATAWARALGTTFDSTSTTGALAFSVVDGAGDPFVGATVTTTPAGRIGFFAGPGGGIDGTLTMTASPGGGWVYDLPSGTVGVGVTAPGKTCTRLSVFGWAPTAAGETLAAPVRAGEVSIVRVACE